MTDDHFVDTKINIINFNRFIISIINVHNHFNINFLILFFSFKIFSTTDKKFEIEVFRRFSCQFRDARK